MNLAPRFQAPLGQDPQPVAPQEPRPGLPSQASVGPVNFTGADAVRYEYKTLDQRREEKRNKVWASATRGYVNNTLPVLLPDPSQQTIVKDGIQALHDGTFPRYKEALSTLPKDVQSKVYSSLDVYKKEIDIYQVNPLSIKDYSVESERAIIALAQDPMGLEIMQDLSSITGDDESLNTFRGILTYHNTAAKAKSLFGSGPAGSHAMNFDVAGAKAMFNWGDELLVAEKIVSGEGVYPSRDLPSIQAEARRNLGDDPEAYRLATFEWVKRFAKYAKEKGVDFQAIDKMPTTTKEAQDIWATAMQAVEDTQKLDLQGEISNTVLWGKASQLVAIKKMSRMIWSYHQLQPDDNLGEVLDDFAKIASGSMTQRGEAQGNENFVSFAFDLITRPDQASNALSFGAQPKIRATELVFSDGYVAYNTLDAATHALKLRKQGGVWEPNPEAHSLSEAIRGKLLGKEALDRGKTLLTTPGGQGASLGAGVDLASSAYGFASWSAGNIVRHVTGDFADAKPGVIYAKPVGVFEKVKDLTPWALRKEDMASAIVQGHKDFVFNSLYENAMSSAQDGGWAKFAAGLFAIVGDGLASPWNLTNTGALVGSEVAASKNSVLRAASKVPPPLPAAGARLEARTAVLGIDEVLHPERLVEPGKALPKPARNRVVRFSDGKEMSTEWAGVFDAITGLFRKGSAGDVGGGEEFAEAFLTSLRDSPETTLHGFMDSLKGDEKFIDRLQAYLPDSGLGPGWKAHVAEGVSKEEAKRRWAMDIWEQAAPDAERILEVAPLVFGQKSFWTERQAQRMMENNRGFFMGPIGLPTTPVFRLMEKLNNGWTDFAKSRIGAEHVGKVEKAVNKAFVVINDFVYNSGSLVLSGFSQSHWTNGLAADSLHILPEARPIPYRMKKLYAEKRRRVLANATQRVHATVSYIITRQDGFPGHSLGILEESDRKLLTLAAASGETVEDAVRVIEDSRELLKNNNVVLPRTELGIRKKLLQMEENIKRLREVQDLVSEGMIELGLFSPEDLVDNYVTHFFRGAERQKVMKYLAEQAKQLKESGGESAVKNSKVDRGTSSLRRHGPVDLYEAMRMGFDPELDSAMLMSFRLMQHAEITTNAQFLSRLAAEYGTPVVRGREAAMKVIRSRNVSFWEGEKRYLDSVAEIDEYHKSLSHVRSALKSGKYKKLKAGLEKVAASLGVEVDKLASGAELGSSMLRSDKFLRMASSRRRSALDKVMPKSLREAFRSVSREMISHRRIQGEARAYLAGRGLEPGILARLSDDDLGTALALHQQQADMGESINAHTRRFHGASEAKAYVDKEVLRVGEEVKAANAQKKELLAEREKISKDWDVPKDKLVKRGYHADDLPAASAFEDVRREVPDVVPQFKQTDEELFDRYKINQRQYKENFQDLHATEDDILYWQNQLGFSASRQDKAAEMVAASKRRLDEAVKEKAARKAARRKHGKGLLAGRETLDDSATRLLEASTALREAESRMAFLMDGPEWRMVSKYLGEHAGRLARMHRGIRKRVADFAFEHGVTYSVAKHRVLARKSSKAIGNQADKAVAQGAKRKFFGSDANLPPHVDGATAERYERVEDMFAAFRWEEGDVSRVLWEVFGAHHIGEVPIAELETFVGPESGLYVKMGRFLFNPSEDASFSAILSLGKNADRDGAYEIARILGLKPEDYLPDQLAKLMESKLDDLFTLVEKGDEKAIELVRKIDPKKLSKSLVPEDVSGAFEAIAKDSNTRRARTTKARIAGAYGDSAFQRRMSNTYIPLDIGLVHRQMVSQGIVTHNAAKNYVKATMFMNKLADFLGFFEGVNRSFKVGVLTGRGNFKFVHRNAWFDGIKSMIHTATYGAFNPEVRREFYKDMVTLKTGMRETASGLQSLEQWHSMFDTQGASVFAARMDDLSQVGRSLSLKQVKKERKRFKRTLADSARETTRKKGVGIPRGGGKGALVGGLLGAAVGDPLLGASVGFTAGSVVEGALRNPVHSAARMPTKLEWILGTSGASNEALENWYRRFMAWTYWKGGMGPKEAFDKMNTIMRDYSNLKPFTQNIVSRTPFMFWNFTQQNAIAMGARFLDSPARTTLFPRLISAFSDDMGEKYRDSWMSVASTVFFRGKAFYQSDEMEAAVQVFEPLFQFFVNQSSSGTVRSLERNMSPVVKEILRTSKPGKLPAPIARKMYKEHGNINLPGLWIGPDPNGVITSEVSPWWEAGLVATGLQIAINDVGRTRNHIENKSFVQAALEFMGFPTQYDQNLAFEARLELMNDSMKKAFKTSENIKMQGAFSVPAPYFEGRSAQEKNLMHQLLQYANGKHFKGLMEKYKRLIEERTKGKSGYGTATPYKTTKTQK